MFSYRCEDVVYHTISSSDFFRVSGSQNHTNGIQTHARGDSTATAAPTEPTLETNNPMQAGATTIPIRPKRLLATALAVARIEVGKTSAEMVAEMVHTAIMQMLRK